MNWEWAERQKLYNSKRWRKLRARFLRDHPTCTRCGAASEVADHKYGHGPGWQERFWDVRMLQPLCKRCHSTKTNREEKPVVVPLIAGRLRDAPWRKR